jgi:hypothetical protein
VGQEHLLGAVDLDPLQGRRSSKVLVARNRLLKSTFRPRPRVAADTIVQSLSGDADALLDCYNKKGLQMQPFSKRLKGFEPSTFCMAISSSASQIPLKRLQIAHICGAHVGDACPRNAPKSQGLDNERTMKSELGPVDHAVSRLLVVVQRDVGERNPGRRAVQRPRGGT